MCTYANAEQAGQFRVHVCLVHCLGFSCSLACSQSLSLSPPPSSSLSCDLYCALSCGLSISLLWSLFLSLSHTLFLCLLLHLHMHSPPAASQRRLPRHDINASAGPRARQAKARTRPALWGRGGPAVRRDICPHGGVDCTACRRHNHLPNGSHGHWDVVVAASKLRNLLSMLD